MRALKRLTKLSEAEFQEQVIAFARLHGWRVAHFRPARVNRAGVVKYETPFAADGRGFPDLVMVGRGRTVFAELKSGTGKPSADQLAWLKALQANGAEAYLWFGDRDWPAVEKVLGGAS